MEGRLSEETHIRSQKPGGTPPPERPTAADAPGKSDRLTFSNFAPRFLAVAVLALSTAFGIGYFQSTQTSNRIGAAGTAATTKAAETFRNTVEALAIDLMMLAFCVGWWDISSDLVILLFSEWHSHRVLLTAEDLIRLSTIPVLLINSASLGSR